MRDWNDEGSRGGGFGRGGGGSRFGNERSMTPPVREGEETDVTIESVGEKGDGMAKVQGFVLFVPGTKAGDRVRVKVTRVLAKVGFAQMIGPAQTAAAPSDARPAKKEEPAFDPKEDLDSEDFGDESGDSDDDEDEGSDEEEA